MLTPGQRLRELRENLGLNLRQVEEASERIAARTGVSEYLVSVSRLSDIETKGVLPTIYRLYSLSAIYRRPSVELLAYFGIDDDHWLEDGKATALKTQTLTLPARTTANVPVKMDPSFDLNKTSNIGRMVEKWGVVPLVLLEKAVDRRYTYGYIGLNDYMMYPLVLPGSFVQVDEDLSTVETRHWKSEYERPIYMVESREGVIVSWCTVKGGALICHPHPLSPSSLRMFKHGSEAEVIGQVVSIAMRLDGGASPNGSRQALCD